MNISVERYWKALESEFSEYYVTILSRKAGAPICMTLCVLTIVAYALLHI